MQVMQVTLGLLIVVACSARADPSMSLGFGGGTAPYKPPPRPGMPRIPIPKNLPGGIPTRPNPTVNFVISQCTALILAGFLRIILKPGAVSPVTRHIFGLVVGLCLGYFCFGIQAIHLAGLPAVCYIVMRTQDPRIVQRAVLTVALAYLSCIHYYRQINASYYMDVTGPLMVITQKVISLAYSIHDGFTRREIDLTPLQRRHAVRIMPTALEYFSYVFHFQALMAGPVIFYRDYIEFIHGTKVKGGPSFSGFYDDPSNHVSEIVLEPSPERIVIEKIIAGLICALVFVVFMPIFPIQAVKDDDFLESSIFYKFSYLMISTMAVRFKYYYAWLFADAICNYSGLGYNGLNAEGNPRWDLVSNVDVLKFELSLNLREAIDAWNKGTNRWLRMVVYERGGRYKTLLTYSLSVVWHGFYPGYYLTFALGALGTYASRNVRKCIRPYFIGSRPLKFFYDTLTFITTRIFMAYLSFTFVLLELIPSIKVYASVYFIPHLLLLLAAFVLPILPIGQMPQKREASSSNGHTNNHPISTSPEGRNGLSKKTD